MDFMEFKTNWSETKQRFMAWWEGKQTDRPLMWVTAVNDDKRNNILMDPPEFDNPEDSYTNAAKLVERYRYSVQKSRFLAESFPNLDLNLGAGSMALYLGSEPSFSWDTVWFNELPEDFWQRRDPLKYQPENTWWKKHIAILKEAKQLSRGEFCINIPDIVENADILASLRGTQNLLYDLIDQPDMVSDYISQIDDLYFIYYDYLYDLVKLDDGSSVYTAFRIWGPGKTAKLQCDFSAMIGPEMFREFILPSIQKQCRNLDHTIYHLDGPDAIKHLGSLLEIDDLNAIQWTPGAGNPDGGSEIWYPIYDKITSAGKSLHITLEEGGLDDWINKAGKLVKRYDCRYLYLLFPRMREKEADLLLRSAEHGFRV